MFSTVVTIPESARGRRFKIDEVFVYLLLFALLLDIGGGIGVKYVATGLALGWAALRILAGPFPQTIAAEVAIVGCVVFVAICGVLRGVPVGNAVQEISFVGFFLITPLFLRSTPREIQVAFYTVALCGAIVIIVTFGSIGFSPNLAGNLNKIADSLRLGYLGLRPGFENMPNVYFRWTIWVLLGSAMALYGRKYLGATALSVSAVLSMSAAMIAGLALIVLIWSLACICKEQSFGRKLGGMAFVVLMVGVSIYFVPDIVQEFILSKFSAKSESTSIKLQHVRSILNQIQADPSVIFLGQGPGAYFYSAGAGSYVQNVEVSYLNALRQYGVIGVVSFVGYIGWVFSSLSKCGSSGKPWIVGLTVMLIVAGTNPVLLSPIYIVPLVMGRMYAHAYLRSQRVGECGSG